LMIGDEGFVKALLEENLESIDTPLFNGRGTILHLAAYLAGPNITSLVLTAGLDFNL